MFNHFTSLLHLFSLFLLILQVFEEYFERLEEESIRDNFVITYELLDEMVDYGYPQTTEAKVLKQYVDNINNYFVDVKLQDL